MRHPLSLNLRWRYYPVMSDGTLSMMSSRMAELLVLAAPSFDRDDLKRVWREIGPAFLLTEEETLDAQTVAGWARQQYELGFRKESDYPTIMWRSLILTLQAHPTVRGLAPRELFSLATDRTRGDSLRDLRAPHVSSAP